MADRHIPTKDWQWPGEAVCGDCGCPYRPRFPCDTCPSCPVPLDPGLSAMAQLRRDRDELVEALEAWQSAAALLLTQGTTLNVAGALAGAHQRAADVLARVKGR